MFNSIKLYIYGVGAAIVGVLYAIVKYQSHQIEELEEENAAKTKKIEINSTIEKAQIEAEKDEETKQANINSDDWRNNI